MFLGGVYNNKINDLTTILYSRKLFIDFVKF